MKGTPPPTSASVESGPQPRGGWGLVAGGFAIWAFVAIQFFLSGLGLPPPLRALEQLYGGALNRGWPPAWDVLGVWVGHLWHGVLALGMALAALGFGGAALALCRVGYPGPGARAALALGTGYALFGLLMLGGGLTGLWRAWWPVALMGAGLGLGLGRRPGVRPLLRGLVPPPAPTWGAAPFRWLALATAAFWVVVALVPEVFYDSLVYHLADPFNWVKVHKVTALPYNFFSNFPFTFEMLFGVGVLFGSDEVARLAHVGLSFTAAGLLGAMAAWLTAGTGAAGAIPSAAGWMAAAIYLTTPLIANSAWMTGIDAGLVFYEAGLAFALLLWLDRRRDPSRLRGEPHWLWIAAALGGLGMGAKYTLGMTIGLAGLLVALRVAAPSGRTGEALRAWLIGILAVLLPATASNLKEVREWAGLSAVAKPALAAWGAGFALATLWLARRWGWRRTARGIAVAILFGCVAETFVAPWNGKAWLFTRNPVYPFAFRAFDSFHVSPPRMDYQMGEFREFQWRPLKEWIIHPWHLTRISGLSNNSSCGGVYLVLLPLLFGFKGIGEKLALLGILVLGRYLLWSNVSNIVRYFAPGLALLGVMGAVWIEGFCARRPWARATGRIAVGVGSAINLYGILLVAQASVSFLGAFLGSEPARDFRLRERAGYPCPPYAACEAMNRALAHSDARGSSVLFVGEARGSFYRGPLVAATVFDFPPLIDACVAARDERDLQRTLRQLGVRYVLFNGAEAQRIAGYRIFDWPNARARALFERWWAGHLALRWKGGWLEIYEIVPGGVRERTAALQLVHAPFDEFDHLVALERRCGEAMRGARWEEAVGLAEELTRRAPGVASAHELLAQALAYRGQDRRALAEFRKAVALGLANPQARYNAAVLLRRLGREEEASREIQAGAALERMQGEWRQP